MKFTHGEDWQLKIARLKRLALNVSARQRAGRFTPPELSVEDRERVESLTRFERIGSRIIKQNWAELRVTNG